MTIDEDIAAGLHQYPVAYEVGQQTAAWTVDGTIYTFNLRITDTSAIIPEEKNDGSIRIMPSELSSLEKEVAAGCVIAALIPSIFIAVLERAQERRVGERL